MDKYVGQSLDTVCRTCLKILDAPNIKYDVFDEQTNMARKLAVCTALIVEANDIYPKCVCEGCYEKLTQLYDFQIMCIESLRKFQEMFVQSVPKEEVVWDESLNESLVNNDDEEPIEEEGNTAGAGSDEDFKEEDGKDDESFGSPSSSEEDEAGERVTRNAKKEKKASNNDERKIYQCHKCPQRFFRETRFNAHIRFHEGLKPYVCPHPGCNKEFAKASGLGVHVRDIHGENTQIHACPQPGCDKSYKRRQTLRWHIRTYHSETPKDADAPMFICEDCGKTFKNHNSLKKHKYKHNGKELPFECPECQRRYMTNHKLKEHMMRHAGIKNFECPFCGMRKTTKTELKVHINYHTKEKQYPCSFCDQVFNSTGNLSRHKRIVHEGVKIFPCQYCGRKFGKAETCRHHEMIHTGEKPHACPVCGKRFIQLVAMRVHLKRHDKSGTPKRGRPLSSGPPPQEEPGTV